jgi:hypothetical protein
VNMGEENKREEPGEKAQERHKGTIGEKQYRISYIVTRPYSAFRHPDRIAPDSTVRGWEPLVPRPCWYFTFLHAGRHFRNFLEIYPVKKRKSVSREGWNSRPLEYCSLDHSYLA